MVKGQVPSFDGILARYHFQKEAIKWKFNNFQGVAAWKCVNESLIPVPVIWLAFSNLANIKRNWTVYLSLFCCRHYVTQNATNAISTCLWYDRQLDTMLTNYSGRFWKDTQFSTHLQKALFQWTTPSWTFCFSRMELLANRNLWRRSKWVSDWMSSDRQLERWFLFQRKKDEQIGSQL